MVVSLDYPANDIDEPLLDSEGMTLDAKADDERLVLLAAKAIYEQSNWEVLGIRNLVVTLGCECLTVEVVIENEDTKDRVIVAGDYVAATNQWTDKLLSESKSDDALDLDQWRIDKGKGSRGKRTTAPKCNKGRPCGMSCIAGNRNCRINPVGAAEKALQEVVNGGEKGGRQGGNPVYKWHAATSENFEVIGSRKTLKNNLGESIEKGAVFYDDPNATEDQRAYMRFRGQNYIRPYIASAKEFQELFGTRLPDVARQARATGIEGETDLDLAVRWATLGMNRRRGAEAIAEFNLVPIEWTDAPKSNTKSQKKRDAAPTSIRFDRAPLANTERLPDGRLRVRATFSRVGPLNYLRADGTMQQEIVTADELFREDSLETAGLAPVTLGHPPDGMVTPKTWKKYAVGASGSTVIANRVDGLVDVVFVIGDEEAIEAVESGRATEVSAGYSTLVESRGDGRLYQTNRQYNHIAIVERGRAGPEVRLHIDAADDWAVMSDEDEPAFVIDEADLYLTNDAKADDERFVLLAAKTIYEQRGDPSVVGDTFDEVKTDSKGGCDCMPGMMKRYKGMDMEEEVFDAFKAMEGELETLKKDMKGMIPKKDSAYEDKVDALAGENAGLRTRVAALETELGTRMDASAVEEAAQARLDAYMECLPLLPEGVRFDASLSPIEWRKAAIAAANPSVDLDGRSDDFVNGMFSTMQVVTAKADAKVDAAKADGFRRILDSAAVAGHSGSSAESPDEIAARSDAEDIEAINSIFAFKGGSN